LEAQWIATRCTTIFAGQAPHSTGNDSSYSGLSNTSERIALSPKGPVFYQKLEALGANRELLAIVGSWGDTLDDEEVLVPVEGMERSRG
jgi:hypothetical protein